jgi:hypothetical protein
MRNPRGERRSSNLRAVLDVTMKLRSGDLRKFREEWAGDQLASHLNTVEGKDYQSSLCTPDPPDVALVSQTRPGDKREFEIVSVPIDTNLRERHTCGMLLMRNVTEELRDRGHKGFQASIHVNWKKLKAQNLHALCQKSVRVLEDMVEEARNKEENLRWRGVELERFDAADSLRSVALFLHPKVDPPLVSVPFAEYVPSDSRWLMEAIDHKRMQSGPWGLLIEDWGGLVDLEQITDAKRQNLSSLRFPEVWVTTLFHGVHRLK